MVYICAIAPANKWPINQINCCHFRDWVSRNNFPSLIWCVFTLELKELLKYWNILQEMAFQLRVEWILGHLKLKLCFVGRHIRWEVFGVIELLSALKPSDENLINFIRWKCKGDCVFCKAYTTHLLCCWSSLWCLRYAGGRWQFTFYFIPDLVNIYFTQNSGNFIWSIQESVFVCALVLVSISAAIWGRDSWSLKGSSKFQCFTILYVLGFPL